MHIDRCSALALELEGGWEVIGVQWTGKSATYEWVVPAAQQFKLVTLFPNSAPRALSFIRKLWRTLAFCLRSRADAFFFSHYNDPVIVITSTVLALLRKRVFCMLLSKFDDYDRRVGRELLKAVLLRPYTGFLTNRGRSSDYIRFLRGNEARIAYGHNTLSVREIRAFAESAPAPAGSPHSERHFTAITRLVPKKIWMSCSTPTRSTATPSAHRGRFTSAARESSMSTCTKGSSNLASTNSSFCGDFYSGLRSRANLLSLWHSSFPA